MYWIRLRPIILNTLGYFWSKKYLNNTNVNKLNPVVLLEAKQLTNCIYYRYFINQLEKFYN